MHRYLYSIIAGLILLSAAVAASAQTGQLRGSVKLIGPDGNAAPVADAAIDVYRVDLSGHYQTKSDKSGNWVFAGLPYVGTYVVAISAPGAQPNAKGGVKAGREIPVDVVLNPGDGKRLTRDEAISVSKGGGDSSPGGESATDKARREEMERKNAEVAEANKKIENANQIIGDAFRGGNSALNGKNYDEAIRLYDSGINTDADHPGIPSLLTNKSVALRLRAVDRYNAAVQSKDDAARTSGMDAAKADFKASADAANQAADMLKKRPTPADPNEAKQIETNKYFAFNARAESMRLFVTKVDATQVDAAVTAYEEYMAIEPDAVKKTRAQNDLAQMLFDAGAHDKAKVAYEKILAERPDDPDALANMGMILYSLGYAKDLEGQKDAAKTQYQLAANYLQTFVDKAPDSHKLKAGAKEVLDALKQQNVQAEKPATPPRRRRP